MTGLGAMIKRNCKLYFKDKGMFFSSLITPLILLVLYTTFLASVYKNSFTSSIPEGFAIDGKLIDSIVTGQLFSSLLAVCCVTVAFCSNMIMIHDKSSGVIHDILVTPVKRSTIAFSYYISTFVSTLIICLIASAVCLGYMATVAWYYTVSDILMLMLDVILLVMFGTALSSAIHFFLSTEGQMSAVGTIVSAGYGFLCGAYMPLSQFSEGLQKVLSFFPGTYGTSLIRDHAMSPMLNEMSSIGTPNEVIEGIRDSVDCNIYFFGDKVSTGSKFVVLIAAIIVVLTVYVLLNVFRRKSK